MKRILIPFDFTEVAENALVYAISLFENSEITFYLLNVYESFTSELLSDEYSDDWFSKIDDSVVSELKERAKKLNETTADNHNFQSLVYTDSVINSIQHVTQIHSIDLIISGTKGARGKSEIFMNTNTLAIIKRIRQCPTIAVPFDYEFSPVKKIVLSTNFKRTILPKELKPIINICTLTDAHLEIVSLSEERYLNEQQKENKKILEAILTSFYPSFKKIEWFDSEAKTLITYMKSSQSQLLCLVNHKYNFFHKFLEEDVIKRTSFNSEIPLLVVP